MTAKRLHHFAVALAGLAGLAACVSVLPEQPTPEAVFRFAQPSDQLPLPAVLVVREPEASRLLAGRQIAVEGANSGLKVLRGVAWADRATRQFQVAMTDSFSGGAGYAMDDSAGISGDYELYWHVADFTLNGDTGTCKLRLTLLDGGSRTPLVQWSAQASSTAASSNAQARVRALAEAGDLCVAEAAKRVSSEVAGRETDD